MTTKPKVTAVQRSINFRIRVETQRLASAIEAIQRHQAALATDGLTIGKQSHHITCIQLREIDQRNAAAALDALHKAQTWEDYRSVLDLNERLYNDRAATRKVFLAGYLWQVEQYKARGDNANAARMQKQADHWSKPYEEELANAKT